MFSPRTRPLALDAERLLGLRSSLNTPVVATPDLPTGPARAAIVSHVEAGLRRLTVVVRSLRNGVCVLYELEGEDLEATMDFSVALDAALSFAESMGFLFDDDELDKGGDDPVERALGCWREIVGSLASEAPLVARGPEHELSPRSEPEPADSMLGTPLEAECEPEGPLSTGLAEPFETSPAPEELLLVEVAEELAAACPREAVPAEPPPSPPDAVLPQESAVDGTLTKFRPPPGAEAARNAPSRRGPKRSAAPVGRVHLVRRPAPEAPPPVSPLLRLLACF